ncbi:MAG: class I SAM-dependent methyltransferase [Promethearchaeota archaeon]
MEEPKETYWSKFAADYADNVDYVVGKDVHQAIIKKLSEERNLGEVIELGCGTGYFTKIICKNSSKVIATDLSDEMLEQARIQLKEFQNVIVQKANCESTPFPSGRFDTVFMANLIHFVENPLKTLQESYRLLKTGGLLLITSYTSYSMKRFEKIKLVFRFLRKCGRPPSYARNDYSPDELSTLVESAGFDVKEIQLIGDKTKALYLRTIRK